MHWRDLPLYRKRTGEDIFIRAAATEPSGRLTVPAEVFRSFEKIEGANPRLRRQDVHDPVDPCGCLSGSALFAGGQHLPQLGGLRHERALRSPPDKGTR